jgi:hypothetical protein
MFQTTTYHATDVYGYRAIAPSSADIDRALPPGCLGIEVTDPQLAAFCDLGNLDPQHTFGGSGEAAIVAALSWPLPPAGSCLVTVKPDADSVGAMAVITARRQDLELDSGAQERIVAIARADSFGHGPWPGRARVPREPISLVHSMGALEGPRRVCADTAIPLRQKVASLLDWIQSGRDPTVHSLLPVRQDPPVPDCIDHISVHANRRIALVQSTQPAALVEGYKAAPVVIACHPSSLSSDATSVRHRYTIAQWSKGLLDLTALRNDLNSRDPGWGGTSTIVGSPQPEGSFLPLSQVLQICTLHLACHDCWAEHCPAWFTTPASMIFRQRGNQCSTCSTCSMCGAMI